MSGLSSTKSKTVRVPVTTLDALIDRYGSPSFIKLDVEGFEVEALAGLTQPVPALSFEFTTIQRDLAIAGIERCAELGFLHFNAALGESQGRSEYRKLARGAADGRQFGRHLRPTDWIDPELRASSPGLAANETHI